VVLGVQEPSTEPSRAAALQEVRQEKAKKLQTPNRPLLEKALLEFRERRIMERFNEGFHGFHPLMGSLHNGAGFSAGTFVERDGLRVSGQVSMKGYEKYDIHFTTPPMAHDLLSIDLRATHRNFSQERFFGLGPSSREDAQTNFRLEDNNYVARLNFMPSKPVKVGVLGGWLETNVGTGTDLRSLSSEKVFTETEAPGISNQPTFLQLGAFVEADYRDQPGNPRSGGRYAASWTSFNDRKLKSFDFSQYDVDVQQYFPFFNERRVIALRAKATLTDAGAGQSVPFFMQPTLGGSEDLRGFREYRFRDQNMVVLNAEYRWEAFSGLDLAVFGDAGQVAAKASDLKFGEFKTSYGAGLRFNTAKSVFLRLDLGFSQEGRQLFLKFGHVF
jgi:outer membrane protein assembly factor BamA